MITGKNKPLWYHTPSGRTCKNQEEYDIVTKAWNKKYNEYYTKKDLLEQYSRENPYDFTILEQLKSQLEYDIQ